MQSFQMPDATSLLESSDDEDDGEQLANLYQQLAQVQKLRQEHIDTCKQ